MIRRPPRSTQSRSSAASDVYKRQHWNTVLEGLEALDIEYQIDPALVRGLDYYTRTVFEYRTQYESAQSALGGGGRYDGLAETIGAPVTAGIGFGSGIERLILT